MPEHRTTGSVPIFQQTAELLAQRLSQNSSERARELTRRAMALATIFKGWNAQPPTSEVRSANIHQLLDLQREILDYLASGGQS